MTYSIKNFEFIFIICIYNFKGGRFFALNDVIHVRISRLIHDDLHNVQWLKLAKTETTGEGEEKVKISANPDNFITKIFIAI